MILCSEAKKKEKRLWNYIINKGIQNDVCYLSSNTQVKFGSQFLNTTSRDDGETEWAIHWLPVPLAFHCKKENGEKLLLTKL